MHTTCSHGSSTKLRLHSFATTARPSDNPECRRIAENLDTRHIILGQDHADLELWRATSEHEFKRMASILNFKTGMGFCDESEFALEPPEPFIAPSKPTRNDPCPCSSGKKYKKCCLSSS
jgi:uncharacterized protein YchJ